MIMWYAVQKGEPAEIIGLKERSVDWLLELAGNFLAKWFFNGKCVSELRNNPTSMTFSSGNIS